LPKIAGRVCVHTAHGSLQLKSVKDFAYWCAEFALTRRTDQTIAVSESEAQQLRRLLLTGDRLKTIPNGVVVPNSSMRATNTGATPLRIVHITRFVPQKNSDMVLSILSSLRQKGALDRFHVDMLGDGPERPNLEQEVASLGLKDSVTFHGAQPSVSSYLAKGFCVLTTSRWEGMPLAVLEGLAHGLPAIGTDTPGNNDVISNQVGRLFPLTDSAAAADHLIELAANPATWKQLSNAAVQMVQVKFSVRRMGADTVALYESINPSLTLLARETR
jgi:glycosyltransferase involved in cell wall biosynthesis